MMALCSLFIQSLAACTNEALDRAISEGLAAITTQDARGFFAHRDHLGKPT